MKPFEQQFQNFCYYQGYIEGYPNSMVIISTCTGLRGLLQFENVSYGIEPLEPSIGFEHVIYQVKHKNEGISLYTEEDFEPRDIPYKIQSVEHPRTISLESLAVILAQLLSLSMGIAYDDINKCHCSGAVCIMNPEAIGVKIFSNCSMEDFARFISKSKSQCLQNQPHLDPSYKMATCGNGEVEAGEQCDCGTEETCQNERNQCCEPSSCTLKGGSECDGGICCENCKFAVKGKLCRAVIDDCDLPEYCNGTSAICQSNYYIQNGASCKNRQWFCTDGKCIDGITQCVETYGEGAGFGTPDCFNFLNSKTDVSGHCGSSASGYVKCETKNLMCGKLICTYDKDTIITIKNVTVIYANINDQLCITVDYKYNTEGYESMWVRDGTVCGENKVCKNKECVDNEHLKQMCAENKCNGRGVCNNNNNCHCEASYLPPDCKNEDQSFPADEYIENVYHSKRPRWPYYLLIPFFIALCLLIANLVKVYLQRKKWRTEEYTSDE
ncbi:Disintegrin and metalloproteinase domain-containing protein 2 [Galemys pyrenaicus]|uniref:Disintegrin and metalloproteinase domain-containing protein 2 n=1 Tax=Galemys pyrenaicus TaxID=202257 RepID=A0A8J6DLV4_GALPY|nr:Disintegrin and metalloproteinase domain-containing protein 2 [Galemys pyrenaicus]